MTIWNTYTGERLHRLQGHIGVVESLAWSPLGDELASASMDGTVIIWGIGR